MHAPIGYTYEADVHCPACAAARFGHCPDHDQIACCVTDSEGNEPGVIAPWDSTPREGEWCGDCGRQIAEPWDNE